MTRRIEPLRLALASAMSLPSGGDVPDWIQLLPAGRAITTHDGRGPYTVDDPQAVIAASLANERGMPVDENHATDLAAPKGGPAPARGWIAELQARDTGIWARVEWTETGRALLADRAYRGISPVLMHDKTGTVRAIARASLTNTPNLRGLSPVLNQETSMDFMAKLSEALGLGADATEESILAAVGKMTAKKDDAAPALMSEITALGTAFGVTGDAAAILTGVKAKAGAQPTEVLALQAELKAMGERLTALQSDSKRGKAEAFVDDAIKAGRVGVKPSRDRFISMHMANPADAEAIVNGMPVLGGATLAAAPAKDATTGLQTALSAEQAQSAKLLGIEPAAYLKTLNAEKETV